VSIISASQDENNMHVDEMMMLKSVLGGPGGSMS